MGGLMVPGILEEQSRAGIASNEDVLMAEET